MKATHHQPLKRIPSIHIALLFPVAPIYKLTSGNLQLLYLLQLNKPTDINVGKVINTGIIY